VVPSKRPELTCENVIHILRQGNVDVNFPALLGRRGYYRDSMGVPGRNDNGIYDDAIFVYSPGTFKAFNANTDPSRIHKGVATLRPGLWLYKVGTHGLSKPKEKQYTALVQAKEVWVDRAETPADYGFFGINIHKGGYNTTSSEGCQTIYPDQWEEFIGLVQKELKRAGKQVIPYLLTAR
jgi:lysozyme